MIVLLLQSAAAGQNQRSDCKTNRNAPPIGFYAWPSDARVKVYFVRGMFTTDQRQALLRAMDIWSQASKRNGAGVAFIYAGESDSADSCNDCLTITRREIHKKDPKHYAFFYPMSVLNGRVLRSAWIELDTATTEPKAVEGFMAHELGHGMGLWDCVNCKKNQTIMKGFPGVNKNNGLIAPSTCDLEVMREVFEKQRTANPPTTAAIRVDSNTP